MKYIIITTAHNEEKFINNTIESILAQTLKPETWVIVDDSSKDNTSSIIMNYTKDYNWIKLLSLEFKNIERDYGPKIIRAFNEGFNLVRGCEFDFIVKLDADLSLPANYFEEIANAFNKNKKLGICGGYCIYKKKDVWVKEKSASYHVRGAFKSIRKACWEDINGFYPALGWDGLDEMTAIYKGWSTLCLDLEVIHHRPTAEAYNSLKLAEKYGKANYVNGGNLFLVLVRSLIRITKKPYFLYSLKFLFGYLNAKKNNEPKIVSQELARFINNYHLKRLFSFKRL